MTRAWFLVVLVGCAGEVPPPQLLSFVVSPGSGPVGTEVQSMVEVADFELTEHSHAEGVSDDHTHDHDDGSVLKGHVHIYVDELMSNPVLQQVSEMETFEIPADLAVGEHTLIARLHDANHFIIEPQVMLEQTFEVTE